MNWLSPLIRVVRIGDLRNKILFILGIFVIFRIMANIPIPGIDAERLRAFFEGNQIFGLLNLFTGGALDNLSIVMLGLGPFITATIVMQLLTMIFPPLERMYKEEGEAGKKKFNQYGRMLTIPFTLVQGYGFLTLLSRQGIIDQLTPIVYVTALVTVMAGTIFLMWLGEQITSRGIGNGVSLIIMAGIVAQFPTFTMNMFEGGRTGSIAPTIIIGFIVMVVALILLISFVERAQRRLLIQYPKRATQQGMMQADRSHLPLKLNTAGVIPPIFASSLLLLPLTISSFASNSLDTSSGFGQTIVTLNQYLAHGQPIYMALYALGIVFFCFFYTAVVFDPEETADNLKRNGGFIPGIRPGKRTADYLEYVLTRITVVGAIYLTVVCVVPEYMIAQTGIPLFLGGTSLLIVVNVTVDTISQVQSHLLAHQYGDLIKKAKLKGRMR